MATYIMLTTLTDEGRKTVKQNPARIQEVNKEVEAMGVKILSQYAVLGPYDFVNILDAPSNDVVVKVALELGARGTLQTLTLAAMSMADFMKALK
ncbi:MAG TPA: GYD domain-containing protein [Dehalococcoidia bacterium]|nr:GYD domain-containing protein [Dehalococcoidia bacterium]